MNHMCRFCKQDHNKQRMFKYAARHWAHYDCWLAAKGLELDNPSDYCQLEAMLEACLHGWQLREFPVFKLADWLIAHETKSAPGKSWVDKASGILERTIARAEKETVKA